MRRTPCGCCATHALPYLCTPTGASCLSSELFCSLPACRKVLFDTLYAAQTDALRGMVFFGLTAAPRGMTASALRADGCNAAAIEKRKTEGEKSVAKKVRIWYNISTITRISTGRTGPPGRGAAFGGRTDL